MLYLDPPRPSWTRGAGFGVGRQALPLTRTVTDVAPHLTRLSLTVPPGFRRPSLLPWIDRWRTLHARRLLAGRGLRPAAILSAAGRPSVFIGYAGARRVFWAKDDYVAGAGLLGMQSARIARGQRETARVVDAAVAVTPGLQELWRARVADCALIPAGSDPTMAAAAATATRPDDLQLAAPIAGFVGQISDRIDLGLLESVADTGASLLLVGPRQRTFGGDARFNALVARTNVHWTGVRAYEQLPAYLAAIDVGLIPYTASAFNRASFPLKLLEYLSVGAAVVSTDLPAARWLASPEVAVADGTDFGNAVTTQLALVRRGGPALAARRQARMDEAAQHSWAVRADAFAALLHLAH